MTAGRRGTSRERQVIALLRDAGWVCYRAAGSHGNADIVAMRNGAVLLIQVKSSAQGPFEHFGPVARAELLEEALRAGGQAILCHWPSGGDRRFIHSDLWPEGRDYRHKLERLTQASSGDVEQALRVARVTP